MQIFIELRKLFKFLGIDQSQKFNRNNLTALSLFAYCLIAIIAFLAFEPKTYVDLGNAFFGAVSFLLNLLTLSSLAVKHIKIFNLLDKFEEIIKERK